MLFWESPKVESLIHIWSSIWIPFRIQSEALRPNKWGCPGGRSPPGELLPAKAGNICFVVLFSLLFAAFYNTTKSSKNKHKNKSKTQTNKTKHTNNKHKKTAAGFFFAEDVTRVDSTAANISRKSKKIGKNKIRIIWHLGGSSNAQNTPTGCGNNFPFFVFNIFFWDYVFILLLELIEVGCCIICSFLLAPCSLLTAQVSNFTGGPQSP